jgi:HPr kinase/phosphorylase
MTSLTVHASCVAFGNKAVLIRGKPGSGKSDLVLQLIDSQGYGLRKKLLQAKLVADDQVILLREKDFVFASPPKNLSGKLEIRGRGIVTVSHRKKAKLCLVIDLKAKAEITRMPEPSDLITDILGVQFPLYCVDPSAPSAAARIRSYLSEMHFT